VSEEAYIDHCHDMRITGRDHLKSYSKSASDAFARLAHFIWRLGATRSAVNRVVEAMMIVPSLRRISHIRQVPAPKIVEKTLDANLVNPHEVLYDVIADSKNVNPLQCENAFKRLCELDRPVDRPVKNAMVARKVVVTRVHAELQIADKFSRSKDKEFVANDKYIGCSKPACYFCYLWLCNHKHDYVPPATHYKIIPGCRGPDSKLNEAGATVLMETYAKISREMGQDVFHFLHENARPRTQYMSTEASTRPSSRQSASRG
tara:strand:+ start:15165 stop:15947 length:783 start_codon:yes stop_codon:yes gene_type:complete